QRLLEERGISRLPSDRQRRPEGPAGVHLQGGWPYLFELSNSIGRRSAGIGRADTQRQHLGISLERREERKDDLLSRAEYLVLAAHHRIPPGILPRSDSLDEDREWPRSQSRVADEYPWPGGLQSAGASKGALFAQISALME